MTAVALAPHQIPAAVRGRGRPKAAAPDLVRRGSAEMASGSRRRSKREAVFEWERWIGGQQGHVNQKTQRYDGRRYW
jgi:hypothetical protein